MPKILVADPIGAEGVALLESSATVDVKTGMKPPELLAVISEYDGLVVRSETKVTKEVIDTAKKLQVVGRAGIGVDNIDLDAATSAGIAVVNAPTGNTVAAAEHTMALMLALSRNVPTAHQSLKSGEWKRSAFMGVEVRNKTLGICGLGRVGSEVAQRAQSFGMKLVGFDPFVSPDYARQKGIELLTLEQLLTESDFITLHTPLTDDTRNIVNTRSLDLMQPGCFIVNTARGGLVDEPALHAALESGHLAGAALDVRTFEPPASNDTLAAHPRVLATPHMAGVSQESMERMATIAAANVVAALRGDWNREMVVNGVYPE